MPCNMTAVNKSSISKEALAKMLTPEVVKLALREFAKAQGLTGTVSNEQYYGGYHENQLWIGDVQLSVQVGHEGPGIITCNVGSVSGKGAVGAALTPLLQKHMLLFAGVLMQEKVKRALAARFHVESAQRAPNGAMVVRVDMNG